jgi:hypothetical protein
VAYVRISLITPKAGHWNDVVAMEDELLAFFASQPGFITGYRLTSPDRVGRVTAWESETLADQAANAQHTLALRSRLLPLVETGGIEQAMEGVPARSA